jgi:hypothetical protein
MPEMRLQMFGKTTADPSGTRRFQVVDQGGDVGFRMDLRQKMHVIRVPAEFQKCASPVRQDLAEGALQRVEKSRGEVFSLVLCDKNDMQLERINGMRARLVRLIFPVAKGIVLP